MSLAPTLDPVAGGGSVVVSPSPGLLRRLLHGPLAVGCIVYLLLVVGVAMVAPLVLPQVASQQAGNLLATGQGPSWQHLLGTDTLGRDMLERVLVGTRVTVTGVGEALLAVLALGVPLGLAAGFLGGWVDRLVSWLADLTFAMPAFVVVIVVLTVFSQSMLAGMVAFGVLAAPGLMRVVRSATLPVSQELYIAAARVSGLSRRYIMTKHILPRIAGPLIVQASLLSATALLVQSGLAFLGLVVVPPAPSWGGMVADGISVIQLHPWLIWPPGLAIALTILALGLLGDAVRDVTTERWSAPIRWRARSRTSAASDVAVSHRARPDPDALLSLRGLSIAFASTTVVQDVSFDIRRGETVGLVGESGSGKTMTAMSVLSLLPSGGQIVAGEVMFAGRDLASLPEQELRGVRGKHIGYVAQEPMISLDPAFRIGWQIAEAVRRHHRCSRGTARARSLELLEDVRLREPALVARRYPHQLSGGMAQRAAIARALAGSPDLLIADEPTTALDVTVQAEILDLLRELQRQRKMAILLITHDWGVVADICDRAVVMYAGQVVECAEIQPIVREPLHPYTEALLASNPYLAPKGEMLPTIQGGVPRPGSWPTGCHFHPRCPYATSACASQPIPIQRPTVRRETRCIHYQELIT